MSYINLMNVPDSTTLESTTRERFQPSEDVLLQCKDGKFYLGTVVEVNNEQEQCLIKFLDNTAAWSSFSELTKLSASEPDVTCVLCKNSEKKELNDIVVCNKCGRGYHQFCHYPAIPEYDKNPNSLWRCRKCFDYNKLQKLQKELKKEKKSMIKLNIRQVCSGRDKRLPPPDDKSKLPYDVSVQF